MNDQNPHAKTISKTGKFSKIHITLLKKEAQQRNIPEATLLHDIVVRHLTTLGDGAVEVPSPERVQLAELAACVISALSDRYNEEESLQIAQSYFLFKRSIK